MAGYVPVLAWDYPGATPKARLSIEAVSAPYGTGGRALAEASRVEPRTDLQALHDSRATKLPDRPASCHFVALSGLQDGINGWLAGPTTAEALHGQGITPTSTMPGAISRLGACGQTRCAKLLRDARITAG